MASNIDPTKPTEGFALTEDVRKNFQAAKDEIEALQALNTTLQNHIDDLISRVAALENP